jgi:enoyl-[acyl-carrier-protein] reductase (NADH)
MGQSNYGAAKAGIAAFTNIAAMELKKYATVNCIVPVARTRLTTDATPKMVQTMSILDKKGFDIFNPANVAPMVAYLASDKASGITGEVFRVVGDSVFSLNGWTTLKQISNNGERFTPQILAERVEKELLEGKPRKETLASSLASLM